MSTDQGFGYSLFGNSIKSNDVTAINNYANALKNGASVGEAWRTTMNGTSVAAKQYVLNARKAGKSTAELTQGLNNMTLGAKASTVAMKALGVAKNIALNIGVMLLITGVAKGIDYLIHRTEKMQEALQNSVDEFNTVTDELKSLEEELKTTTERIKELQKLADNGTTSIAEEAELETLKKTNKELARKIALKQQEQAQEARYVLKDSKKNANSTVTSKYKGHSNSSGERFDYENLTPDEELYEAIKAYKTNSKAAVANEGTNLEGWYEDQAESAKNRVEEMYALISPTIDAYEDLINAGIELEGEDKTRYEQLKKSQDAYLAYIYTLNGTKEAFEGLNAEQQRNVLLNRLIKQGLSEDVAKAIVGSISDEDLERFWDKDFSFTPPEMKDNETAEEYGKRYAEAWLKGVQNSVGNANELKSLSDALKSAQSAFELFNEVEKDFNSTGAISAENIQKILSKFPELEDELYEYIMGMRTGASVMDLLKSKSDDMATMSVDAFRRMYLSSNSVSKDMKKQFATTFNAVVTGWDNAQSVMANVNSQIIDANGNVTSTFSEQWVNACKNAATSVATFAQGLSSLFSGSTENLYAKNGQLHFKTADGAEANLVNTTTWKIAEDIAQHGTNSQYWGTYGDLVDTNNYKLLSDQTAGQAIRNKIGARVNSSYWGQYNANVKNQEEFERKQKEFEERMKQYAVTSDDKNSGSGKNEALDNYLKYAENRYKSHQNELRYINDLEWALNNLAKDEKERLDIAGKIEEAYRDHTKNVIKDLKHEIELENKRNNGETARTIELQKEIQRVAHAEAERLRIKLRALGYLDEEIEKTEEIQELQNEWWSAQESIDNRYNDVLDDIQRHADNVADYYDDINKELDKRITKEEALLQIMQGQTDAASKLMDVQTEIDKAIRDSRISLQYLDEKEREGIFNEKDYTKLSKLVKSTQSEIDSLSSRFYNDVIEAYEQDKAYLIETITAEYERQVAMKERELEIAQAQVDLTKKQIQLNNVLAEKNVKQLVERNGQYVWEWVADTDKVRQATEELMDAEAELKQKEYEQKQQEAIDEQQRRIDSIKAEQAANDYRVEKMNEYVDDLSKAIENCVDPIKSFEELAIQLGDAGGDIVNAFYNVVGSISGMGVKTSSTSSSSSGGSGGGLPYTPNPSKEYVSWAKSQMAANSKAWHTADSTTKTALEKANQSLGKAIGSTYDSASGTWKHKHADGTRYTPGGKTLLGEEGFEAFINRNGHLIPIAQPTIGNIDSGGVVFNTEQMNNLRNLWDLSNVGKVNVDAALVNRTIPSGNGGTQNTFTGGIIINAPRDYNDFVRQLTQRIKTKSI